MADELTALGVAWAEESDVRADVAAAVTADAAQEAFEEQALVNEAWEHLRDAEAQLLRTEQIPVKERTSTYDHQLQVLSRDVDAKMKVVQQRQIHLEKKKKQRLEDARAVERRRLEQQQSRAHAAAAPPAARIQADGRVASGMQQPIATGPTQRDMAIPYRPFHRRPAAVVRRAAGGGAANTVATEAVKDYRGGDAVVAAVHNVTITASDRASASGRYLDDGDESVFAARQETLKKSRSLQRKIEKKEEAIKEETSDDTTVPAVKQEELPEADSDFLEEVMKQEAAAAAGEAGGDRDDGTDDDDNAAETLIAPVPQLPAYRVPMRTYAALLDYQREGLEWLIGLHHKRYGGILGDEMGLGKTVQVAALLSTLLASNALLGPVLIVAPLTVVAQWIRELHKWAPELRSCVLHSTGTSTSREALIASVADRPAAVVTTYTTMTQQYRELAKARFQYVILDEGHKICNPETAVTMAAKTFVTPHRLILTGSPIQNTLKELWCLFDFAYRGLLGTQQRFVEEFEAPISASRNPRATKLDAASAVECARLLKRHIQPFLLRRMKRDVNAMLPPKYERVIRCSLTDAQLEAYAQVLNSKDVQALLGVGINHTYNSGGLDRHGRDASGSLWTGPKQYAGQRGMSAGMRRDAFRILHSLRNLCNHVDIFYLKQDDVQDGGTGRDINFRSNNAVRYDGSGKLATLKRLLEYWKAHGHKVLVFSQFRMMLDIIENMCEQEKHSYMRMDGNTPSRDRAILIDRFNTDPSVFVALLTTKVGGLGVNLTGADRVVIFDPDWNPVNDEQARERAWRIGQTREVCVYRMISSGTIEETILHRQLAKTYVTEKVLNDPTLQRCFSMHSFVDAFYLGTEYRARLPMSAQHVVSSVGDLASDEADAAFEGENQEFLHPHVKAEEGPNGDAPSEREHQQKLDILSGHATEGGSSFRVSSHGGGEPLGPRQQSTLAGGAGGSGAERPQGTELGLLQDMVDGAPVANNPLEHDRVGRNLAIMAARDTLERALQPATPTVSRTMPEKPKHPRVKRERET